MDVLVVTESFLPQVNGVTNSVRRVLDHLRAEGHRARVIAPSGPDIYAGFRVERARSVAMPSYREFPIGLMSQRRLRRTISAFRPDVVHLASPATLGHQAIRAARDLGVPTVAVYQTDLIGFAEQYRFPGGAKAMRTLTKRIHDHADLNLAPSSASEQQLRDLGIDNVARWARGVDTDLFQPTRRDFQLRREIGARDDDVIAGYVGRLAPEKELDLLAGLGSIPRVKLVITGGGPERERLQRLLPDAHFLGVRHGEDLARVVASLDVFVHTGSTETFCQSAQEALASGVPVVAPRAGGPVDLFQPGENGYLFTPGDALDLHGYVEVLAGDPWLRNRMGHRAVQGVADRSWRAINDQLLDHYDSVRRRPLRAVS